MDLQTNTSRYGDIEIVAATFDELRSLPSKRIDERYSDVFAGTGNSASGGFSIGFS